MKPREFWIEFEGDPKQDAENYKRYVSGTPFKPIDLNHEVIHVIEVLPYEKDYKTLYESTMEQRIRFAQKLDRVSRALDVAKGHLIRYGLDRKYLEEIDAIESGEESK